MSSDDKPMSLAEQLRESTENAVRQKQSQADALIEQLRESTENAVRQKQSQADALIEQCAKDAAQMIKARHAEVITHCRMDAKAGRRRSFVNVEEYVRTHVSRWERLRRITIMITEELARRLRAEGLTAEIESRRPNQVIPDCGDYPRYLDISW